MPLLLFPCLLPSMANGERDGATIFMCHLQSSTVMSSIKYLLAISVEKGWPCQIFVAREANGKPSARISHLPTLDAGAIKMEKHGKTDFVSVCFRHRTIHSTA